MNVLTLSRRAATLALCLLAVLTWPLVAPGQIKAELQNRRTWEFPAAGVRFSSEFSGARLNDCEQIGDREFRVVISPENEPINKSPWYAFQVWSDKRQTVTVHFTYTYAEHRFRPWLSRDGKNWRWIADRDYEHYRPEKEVLARLQVGPQPLWVAAQEMIGLKEIAAWTDRKSRLSFARESIIGHSLEGRPIRQLVLSQTTNANFLFVIARQHPPEVTGTLGMMSFVDTVAGNSALARAFRRQFQTVVVPLVNPDGIEHGHWRSNLGAVDLNRDWRHFRQPETRAVSDSLLAFARQPGARPFVFLDFHSTHTNIFYAQADERTSFPNGFTTRWRAAIHERCPQIHFRRDDGHSVDGVTSKVWAHEQFGLPSITYEYGYDTDRKLIRRASRVAAQELMRLLLEAVESPGRAGPTRPPVRTP